MKFKGQVSIEYVFIVMISLIIILPVFYIAMMQVQVTLAVSKAEIACDRITSAADYLTANGEGSKTKITIELPYNIDVNNSFLEGKEINYRILTYTNGTDVFSIAKRNLTGYLPTSGGSNIISLEYVGGEVLISEAN
ncbi:MAG: hypothetical protein WC356_01340 [Candidatus Micrarchaeia archaeon]|jgi:uncharacterized protein (UPF0333 family)